MFYLLRHGETDWSAVGRLQGRTDIPLNENGIRQMELAGEYFNRLDKKIDIIISSPLLRAKRSAEIIAKKIGYPKEEIIIEHDFIERCFGLGEGLDAEERKIKLAGTDWNAEPVDDLCKRAETIKKYAEQYLGETILITAHGSIIKAMLVSATNGEFSYNAGRILFTTGEFCTLDYDGKNFNIISEKINPADEMVNP